jgi:hypothetical protein
MVALVAAAAVEGAAGEALETGACPGGSTGRGGKKPPSPADLSTTYQSISTLMFSVFFFLLLWLILNETVSSDSSPFFKINSEFPSERYLVISCVLLIHIVYVYN